jgi:hypothetical protein
VRAFRALEVASFAHSGIYVALLVAALTDGETTALGWAHGVGWILMSIACLVAVRARVIPLRIAVAVVVLGGVGPFFGSAAFLLEDRRRSRAVN